MRGSIQLLFSLAPLFVSGVLHCAPVAHFPLNGNAIDSSGNDRHGTLHGGSQAMDRFGTFGGAIFFNGINDYIDVEQLLFNDSNATVAFWAKSAGPQPNSLSVMVSQGHGYDPRGFAFQYGFPSPNVTNFIWGGPGFSGWWLLDLKTDISQDLQWHHFAMTKDLNVVSVYRDGELLDRSNVGMVFGSYHFSIGRDSFNEDAGHRHFFGSIDDVYVYDNALSPSEIERLYATGMSFDFATFTPRAEFSLGPKANDDSYWVRGWLKLADTSNGINPLTEAVTIKVGPFSHTLPAGSFARESDSYVFKGPVGSSVLDVRITGSSTAGGYSFKSCLKKADLEATTLKPDVQLTIGDDSGQATLDVGYAKFGQGSSGKDWVFPPAQ